jgi:hypothetical protein
VVATACTEGGRTAAVAETADVRLGVPDGRPRIPPGFAPIGLRAYVALRSAGVVMAPGLPSARSDGPACTQGSRVRVILRNDQGKGLVVGRLEAVDDQTVSIRQDGSGQPPLQLARGDVKRVDAYKGGHDTAKIVGALAGMGAGLAGAVLYYAANEEAGSGAPLFIGVIGGAVVGALAAPGATWEPVELGQVRIGLAPVPGGVRLAARVGF